MQFSDFYVKYSVLFYKFVLSNKSGMEKITIYDKTFKTYLPFSEFSKDIDRVADELNRDFLGSDEIPILLCILNGALPFTAELMKRLKFPCELASIKVSSYVGTQTTGMMVVKQPLTCDVTGRKVIIVEDIVDTGYTMDMMKGFLKDKGAKESYICTLFFKPEAYKFHDKIKIDYKARDIQNQFIVGFGLDYNELGRNSEDIYILDE